MRTRSCTPDSSDTSTSASREGMRGAVEHVAGAGAPALGGQQVALDQSCDVDHAHLGVHERLQPAVEVGDDDLPVAALRGPGPGPKTG